MSKKQKITLGISFVACFIIFNILNTYLGPTLIVRANKIFNDDFPYSLLASARSAKKKNRITIPPPVPSIASFTENFDATFTVKETSSISESNNPNWWLSSGAYAYSAGGVGSTVLGDLPMLDPWRVAYALLNSLDTDNGYHPQNIFRFVLKNNKWLNFTQEGYFRIVKDNLSESPNREGHNGLLFFNRYQDAFNLYYAGVRVDGFAVIKKKINGAYYTLAYKRAFDGLAYDREDNTNLLPHNVWIGMRSHVVTNSDNTVNIKLYIDKEKTGNWVLVAEATDDGNKYGGSVFKEGYAGIRTDFMDVEFDDYKIIKN